MKRLLLFILFSGYLLIAQTQPVSNNFNSAIGKTFVFNRVGEINVFKNFKEYDNAVISESKEENNILSRISDGNRTLVLFTKYTPQGYKILSVLDLGKVEKNKNVVLAECRVNAKKDGFLVALVSTKPWKDYFTNITKVWRVDPKTNKFESVPVKGIDCLNIEFGND